MNNFDAAIQKIKREKKLNHHACSFCKEMVYFYTDGKELFFNSSCSCTDLHTNQNRKWEDLKLYTDQESWCKEWELEKETGYTANI